MPYVLYVFGSNGEGQLGIKPADAVSMPTLASSWPSHHNIQMIASGDNHTLFLTTTREVYGVGSNKSGQLGDMPVGCDRFESFTKLRDDVECCAATCTSSAYVTRIRHLDDGCSALITEGTSQWGELGLGNLRTTVGSSRTHIERAIMPELNITRLAAGTWHYIALTSARPLGWGKSRLRQLGTQLSTETSVDSPTQISEPDELASRPIHVVCGKDFTHLASHPYDGAHMVLGSDKHGIQSSMPSSIRGWKQIGATWHAIFVLFEDGTLTAWGKEHLWKLVPNDLPLLDSIAVGSEHILAVTRDRRIISWGWGKHGNCGNLTALGRRVKNDMVSGFWNEIKVPGTIEYIGAGYCTSFILTSTIDAVRT